MANRLEHICHQLWKDGTITFNEWVVITSGAVEWRIPEVLPPVYKEAQAALLKEVDDK